MFVIDSPCDVVGPRHRSSWLSYFILRRVLTTATPILFHKLLQRVLKANCNIIPQIVAIDKVITSNSIPGVAGGSYLDLFGANNNYVHTYKNDERN